MLINQCLLYPELKSQNVDELAVLLSSSLMLLFYLEELQLESKSLMNFHRTYKITSRVMESRG